MNCAANLKRFFHSRPGVPRGGESGGGAAPAAQEFVNKVAISDMFEIQMAQSSSRLDARLRVKYQDCERRLLLTPAAEQRARDYIDADRPRTLTQREGPHRGTHRTRKVPASSR